MHEGVWLPVDNQLTSIGAAHDFASFQQVASPSYFRDGRNLTSTFVAWTGHDGSTPGKYIASWANADLAATETFHKWEVGLIGFGSSDPSTPNPAHRRRSRFALGGLIDCKFV